MNINKKSVSNQRRDSGVSVNTSCCIYGTRTQVYLGPPALTTAHKAPKGARQCWGSRMDHRDPVLAEQTAGRGLRVCLAGPGQLQGTARGSAQPSAVKEKLFQSFASPQLVESTVSVSQSNKRISGEIHPSATALSTGPGTGGRICPRENHSCAQGGSKGGPSPFLRGSTRLRAPQSPQSALCGSPWEHSGTYMSS